MIRRLGFALLFFCHGVLAMDITFTAATRPFHFVELYTSEGCSSCPPADQWLSEFTESGELWKSVFPIAFHVDYWDYLGWKDILADRRYSLRQRQYHRQGITRGVYTPGFLVNGEEWRQWFSGRRQLENPVTPLGELTVRVSDQQVLASFRADERINAPDKPTARSDRKALTNRQSYIFNVALLGMGISHGIADGENEGRTLNHDFAVLAWQQKQSRDSEWNFQLPEAQPQTIVRSKALLVWVTKPDSLKPVAIAGGWLSEPLIAE